MSVNFSGGVGGGNDVLVGDGFKSSCAVGGRHSTAAVVLDDIGAAAAAAGGGGGVQALTSFYDTTVTSSSSCDVTRSNGLTSSFGFTQEQVACVCEVGAC